MAEMFYFDRQDRELLKMINDIIDNGPSSDLEHKIFKTSLHPHGILNLTTTHENRMAQAVINLLGSLNNTGSAEDRLAALRTLHDEVLHSAQTTFRYNTGRVLIQIMKSIIRSRHDEFAQLKLIHNFRKAASGNPRIVREFLNKHHLIEMPEEWNQLTMDHHVHDANTKGRKSATHLIMDAWVKGIRHLTVVYYNYVEMAAARELMHAAEIMGLTVRVGFELRAAFRGRYVNFIWTPRGFSDTEEFLEFLTKPALEAFFAESRKVSLWVQKHVMSTLELWNSKHAPKLAEEYGIDVPPLDAEAFRTFVGNGQPSLLHLAEFAHKSILPHLQARIHLLEGEYAESSSEEDKARLQALIEGTDALTPTFIHDTWLSPECNPELPSPAVPCSDEACDDRPELLRLSVTQLLERLHSIRSGYRITLQLAGLTVEDVLEIVWDGQGIVTHLEIFNVKEWHDGKLEHIKEINELQVAINRGDVMHLKSMLRAMLERLDGDDRESEERRAKIKYILRHIPALQSLYRYAPLHSHFGTDSTSHLGNRYGMGLAVPETLPRTARKRLSGNKYISPVTLPLRARLAYNEEFKEHGKPSSFRDWVRQTLGVITYGMRRKPEWTLLYEDVHVQEAGNIITMGGITVAQSNGLAAEEEQAPKPAEKQKPGRAYLNTTVSNILKVMVGFIPALLTFLNTQEWWVLAWFGAPIWFGITGVRNVIQSVIAGGGIRKNMLLSWKSFVSWSRVCDSLMYTGISVILLEGLTRNLLLSKVLGLTVENYPLLVFSIIALANGIYISSHNIYRGFPKTAVVGNFFRSVLAIPVAMVYNKALYLALPLVISMPPEQILIPAAAIVSKFASDTVAGVIESVADRRNNYRLRKWDYRTKLRHMFDCFTRLELAFPDKDMLVLLAQPREFARLTEKDAKALQVESFITALDLMYFWYYQPCAQQTLHATLREMTREERTVLARFQSILLNVQEVCQLFVDGMLGANFSRALSFYLDNHEDYINTIAGHCSRFDEKKHG